MATDFISVSGSGGQIIQDEKGRAGMDLLHGMIVVVREQVIASSEVDS